MSSSANTISKNIVSSEYTGINLASANSNTLSFNSANGTSQGIQLDASNSNQLFENKITSTGWESNWNLHIPTQFQIIPHPQTAKME